MKELPHSDKRNFFQKIHYMIGFLGCVKVYFHITETSFNDFLSLSLNHTAQLYLLTQLTLVLLMTTDCV